MIIKLPEEIAKKCNVSGNRFLDSIDYEATKILRRVIDEITNEAELIQGNIINAYRRQPTGEPDNLIPLTPESFIKYRLNDYIVYLEFQRFWLFDGVMLSAYPIVNSEYKTTKYPIYVPVTNENCIKILINLAHNPSVINDMMNKIPVRHKNGRLNKENIEYTTRYRPIEVKFYV